MMKRRNAFTSNELIVVIVILTIPEISGITCDVDTKNSGKKGGVITFNFTVSKPNDEQE